MYYYAVVDVNYIVTEIQMDDVEIIEPNFIPIESADYDLVGMWYDIEDQTFKLEGYRYLYKLAAVDGASSNLDADKLDGKDASEFALANHTHTGVPEHTHDEYAEVNHTHSQYSPMDHTHTGFASSSHTHTDYASSNHNHDADYATATHTHTGFASSTHNHDDDYAGINHSHTNYAAANHSHTSGTFTSNPRVEKTNPNLVLRAINVEKGVVPEVDSYCGNIIEDKNGNVLANVRYILSPVGDGSIQLRAFDYSGNNFVEMRLNQLADGTKNMVVPNLVRLESGLQAIYTNGSTNMQFGSGVVPTMINGKDDIFMQTRADTRSIVPNANNTYQIGNSSKRYKSIYLTSAANVSSDRRLKQDIVEVDADEMLNFVDNLNVVNYAFKDDPETERIGLIAQEVEEVGGDKFIEVGEDGMYGLKTADLVYPLIGAVQALYSKVLELEARLN